MHGENKQLTCDSLLLRVGWIPATQLQSAKAEHKGSPASLEPNVVMRGVTPANQMPVWAHSNSRPGRQCAVAIVQPSVMLQHMQVVSECFLWMMSTGFPCTRPARHTVSMLL